MRLPSSSEPVTLTVKATNPENGNWLKFDAMSGPSHGKLTKFINIDHNSATVTYTPEEDYSGHDAFNFKLIKQTRTVAVLVI